MTDLLPLKRTANITLGKMVQVEPTDEFDIQAPYLRAANIQPGGRLIDVVEKRMWFQPDELASQSLQEDDVVIVEGGAGYGRSAVLTKSLPGWGFQNSILRVRTRPERADGRFINFAIQSALESGQIAAMCNTATIPHFTADKVSDLLIPSPPLPQQRTVADYLDRETARIDTLIAKQEQLIATLRERRAEEIRYAVTDSGIFKFRLDKGKVPGWHAAAQTNWKSLPIRRIGATSSGSGFPPDLQGNRGLPYPFYKVKHLTGMNTSGRLRNTDDTIDEPIRAQLHATLFPPGTLAYAKVGAALLLGRFAVLSAPSCIDNNMAGLVPNHGIDPEYLIYACSLIDFSLLVNPGAVPSMSDKNFTSLNLPMPPLDEQLTIVRQLQRRLSDVDALISKTEQFIALSRERRAALITAAVTGQIDVSAAA